MLPAPFSVTFDHEQTRVQRHAVSAVVGGDAWDIEFSDPGVWLDPVTQTLMLRPSCLRDGWYTSNAGVYAKPAIGAYQFLTAGEWSAQEVYPGAGSFMQWSSTAAAAGEYCRTVTAPGKNRGVFVAFHDYSAGDRSLLCSFGWHDTDVTVAGSTLAFEVYSDGVVTVYKGGVKVGQGTLDKSARGSKETPWSFVVLPGRKREVLVLTAQSGFRVVFEDIAEDAASPEITPNTKVWWRPNDAATQAQVQLSPLAFDASAVAVSRKITFTRPPALGSTYTTWVNPVFTGITDANLYGDTAYSGACDVSAVGLLETDAVTAFVPDGVLSQCRMSIELTSGGSYTAFVYGSYMEFGGATGVCDDSEKATPDTYLRELSMSVPDDPFGTTLDLLYGEPDAMEATVPKLRTVSNRPVKLEVGSLVLLDGRTKPTRFTDSLSDETKLAAIQCRDMTAALDAFQFRDVFPLDGYHLCKDPGTGYSAVQHVLLQAGFTTAQMQLSDVAFTLPEVPSGKAGEWAFAIEPGDTARKVLESLHSTHCASFFMGVRPTAAGPVFCFLDPADLSAVPVMALFRSQADSVTAGHAAADAWQWCVTSYEDQPEDVDANEVWATGFDHRTDEVVQSYSVDTASQDCTVAPSLRPDEWIGEPKLYGVSDPRLRSSDACDRVVSQLVPVVGSRRLQGEFTTATMLWYDSGGGVMLPVWRGDLVTLDGVELRITSVSFQSELNKSGSLVTGAKYTFGGFTNSGGNSLASIQSRNNARRAGGVARGLVGFGGVLAHKVTRRSVAP